MPRNREPAWGERDAITGYYPQYCISAAQVIRALRDDTLQWIAVADCSAFVQIRVCKRASGYYGAGNKQVFSGNAVEPILRLPHNENFEYGSLHTRPSDHAVSNKWNAQPHEQDTHKSEHQRSNRYLAHNPIRL